MSLSWLRGLRPRPEWLPRCSVGLGIGSTIAMNVAGGSRGGPGGALVAALYPVAFVIALETLIFMVRRLARLPWGWAWCLGAGIPLLGMAAITGVISYLHALTVVEWTGSTGLPAHLGPFVPDQLIVTGSVALVALAVAGKKTEPKHGDDKIRPPAETQEPASSGQATTPKPVRLVPAQPAARRQQSRGGRVKQGRTAGPALRPQPGDPPAAAVLAAVSANQLAADYPTITRWRAQQLRAPGSYALAVNGTARGEAAADG